MSRSTDRTPDDLPPAVPALWRTFRLGYRAEPRLLAGVARHDAADDAARRPAGAVAEAAHRRRARRRPHGDRARPPSAWPCRRRRRGTSGVVNERLSAPLPRPAGDRHRVPRRPPPGDGADDRAPGAARVPRPAGRAARPGRSRSTTCSCRCSATSAGCSGSSSPSCCWRRSTRRWRCSLLAGLPAVLDVAVAAGRRAAPSRSPSPPTTGWPATCSSLGHDAGAGQGGARHRHRRRPARAPPGGAGALVRTDRRRPLGARRCGTSLAWAVFGLAYVGGIVFVAPGPRPQRRRRRARRRRRPAPVAVHRRDRRRARVPARRLARLVAAARRGSRTTPRRSTQDADRPSRPTGSPTASASSTCRSATPAPTASVLDDVDLHLPAGAVVAIVGENGAGKTTLVKLLAGMYRPTCGPDHRRRRRPGDDAGRRRGGPGWPARSRTSSASSYVARQSVGVGDEPRLDDEPAVGARRRPGRRRRRRRPAAGGLDTQLGPTWETASRSRFGQWQKLALARGFMRDEPLVLVLDEPTAALDAETEHALFERYADARRATTPPTAASRCSCRTASRRCAWPTSSSCSTAPGSSRSAATRSSSPGAGSTPSCSPSRPAPTADRRPCLAGRAMTLVASAPSLVSTSDPTTETPGQPA